MSPVTGLPAASNRAIGRSLEKNRSFDWPNIHASESVWPGAAVTSNW